MTSSIHPRKSFRSFSVVTAVCIKGDSSLVTSPTQLIVSGFRQCPVSDCKVCTRAKLKVEGENILLVAALLCYCSVEESSEQSPRQWSMAACIRELVQHLSLFRKIIILGPAQIYKGARSYKAFCVPLITRTLHHSKGGSVAMLPTIPRDTESSSYVIPS